MDMALLFCAVFDRARLRGSLAEPVPDGWDRSSRQLLTKVATVLPSSAGVAAMAMPASRSAAIFSAAVPLPPLMMAPAWPMRLPGGAVWPAMKAATGFFMFAFTKRAASSSEVPPISPIIRTASVCGSRSNSARQSTKSIPLTGSPPMPIAVDWPRPSAVSWCAAS